LAWMYSETRTLEVHAENNEYLMAVGLLDSRGHWTTHSELPRQNRLRTDDHLTRGEIAIVRGL
jgi:hypothetical protein